MAIDPVGCSTLSPVPQHREPQVTNVLGAVLPSINGTTLSWNNEARPMARHVATSPRNWNGIELGNYANMDVYISGERTILYIYIALYIMVEVSHSQTNVDATSQKS